MSLVRLEVERIKREEMEGTEQGPVITAIKHYFTCQKINDP